MQTVHEHRTLKEKHRQEREQLILQVAEEVFAANGFFDTSMDEIAARVGIGKGTIYLHFPGKEELLKAIFTRDMHSFLNAIDEAVYAYPPLTARAKLEAIFRFMYTGFYSKRTRLFSSIYHSPELQRFFCQKEEGLPNFWEQLAQRVGASVMVNSFFCLQSPRTYEALVAREHMSSEELVKHLEHIYFKGILPAE
jgi:TetR/AcrR family fatty acid metabolism transcriptional regulator